MNNKMPKPKKIKESNGSLPDYVINHIQENTIGGFLIFYFNQNTGQPEQAMSFDTPAHALAIQKYMADWDEAIHQVNIENSIGAIQRSFGQKEDEDGEND